MEKLTAPINWYGGKGLIKRDIVRLFPDKYDAYIEPFGGAGTLLFWKKQKENEIYNDIHSGVVNFYRVLRNPEKKEKLKNLIEYTPYSREEFFACRETWPTEEDDVLKAWKFFIVAQLCHSGSVAENSPSFGIRKSQKVNGINASVGIFRNAIARLELFHRRLQTVVIEQLDAIYCIRKYDSPGSFFFVDPPYVHETRSSKSHRYTHEYNINDHLKLLETLQSIQGKFLLCAYQNSYNIPPDWEKVEIQTFKSSSIYREKVKEIIFSNYTLIRQNELFSNTTENHS